MPAAHITDQPASQASTSQATRTLATNDIICIGVACIDHLSIVERTPEGWERCGAPLVQGGGPAATGAVAAARLGASVELWSILGDDYHGQIVRSELATMGVDVSQFITLPGTHTPSSFIEVDSVTGDRTIYGSGFTRYPREAEESFDVTRARYARSMLVTETTPIAATEACRVGRANGAVVVADLFWVDGPVAELVSLVDALIMPEESGEKLAGGRDFAVALAKMADLGPRMPVVTVGAKGSYYLADGKVYHCPAFKVNVVDTTGCGDSFHGAFAYAMTRGWDVHEAIRFAAAVAALKATKLGGRTGLPTLPAVLAFLEARPDDGRAEIV